MHITIDNAYQLRDLFKKAGRESQFTYDGISILFEYFEQYEEDTGASLEIDIIAICCDFAEVTPEEIAGDYSIDISECDDADAIRDTVLEYLEHHTTVCGLTSSHIIYATF